MNTAIHTEKPSSTKRILFSVLGLSPQILTETLYALVSREDPFIPTEIHVLTTAKGAEFCRLALFHEGGGWFHKLCQDYDLPNVKFVEADIETIENNQGEQLFDIRSREDNSAVANQIMKMIRSFTEEDEAILHVSIAGGRKTMGFYAGYALSIFGRDQDELSHVLVDEVFESHPQFFYPTPYSSVIRSRDGQALLEQKDAKVDLALIPFVRLGHLLKDTPVHQIEDFSELVSLLQKQVTPTELILDIDAMQLMVEDKIVELTPVNFAFYYWLIQRQIEGQEPIITPFENEPDQAYAEAFLSLYENLVGDRLDIEKTQDALKNGMDAGFIRERKARINKILKQQLALKAEPLLIIGQKDPQLKRHRYFIDIKPEQVKII